MFFFFFLRTFENHKNFYAKYMPLVEVEKGLKNKQLFEGVIRISQKCTSEAYVPSPVKRNLCNFL